MSQIAERRPTQVSAIPHAAEDAVHKIPFRIFKVQKRVEYRQLQASLEQTPGGLSLADDTQKARLRWLRLATVVNPRAAYIFWTIAEAVDWLQGGHDEDGHDTSIEQRKSDPLTYLENHQFVIRQKWMETLLLWEREFGQSAAAAEHPGYVRLFEGFQKATSTCHEGLKALEMCMSEGARVESHGPTQILVNSTPAWNAVRSIASGVSSIEEHLERFVTRLEVDAPSIVGLHAPSITELQYEDCPSSQHSILRRRRRVIKSDSEEEGINSDGSSDFEKDRGQMMDGATTPKGDNTPQSQPSAKLPAPRIFPDLPVAKSTYASNRATAFQGYVKLRQSELVVLALLFSCISGILVGIGIFQPRPPLCVPSRRSRDDGFWTLLSQVFLQLLSIFTTLMPLVRDKAVSLRRGLFATSLAVSALAAISSPVLYGFSWQASVLVSFASAFASLMGAVQLAGGVRKYKRKLEFPSNGH